MFLIRNKFKKCLIPLSSNLYQSRILSSAQNETKSPLAKESKQFDEQIVHTKTRRKLPSRQPLVKNFFVGQVDKELLSFPENISRDDMAVLCKDIESIKYYFENNTVTATDEAMLNDIKDIGLFGLNIPQIYNGKEYNWSESLLASQYEIKTPNIAAFLLPHRTVCDVINNYGTEQQKQKYLPKLSNGSLISADAILESNNENNQFFSTTAEYSLENESWTLKGEKSFLAFGQKIDIYLVLAETPQIDHSGNSTKGITLFIVDTTLPGVKVGKSENSFGYTTVQFENVSINNDDILGKVNEASETAQLLLQNNRIRSSYVGLGIMKNMLNSATNYITEKKSCGIALKDVESINTHLSKIACRTYAMESLIYFTTGLIDEFENQDTDIESAIVKLYSLDSLWDSAIFLMDFMGTKYMQPDQTGELDIRNITKLYTQGESTDSLRLFIALSGLKQAGMMLHETVNKQRNPLFHPKHMLSKFFQSTTIETPKTKMLLNEHLHPSLEAASQCLEHSIYRLFASTELLLTRYGNEIVEKHSEIKRLTEMVTLIYATFASLARSSRSYCIGLKLADYEMLIASTIALNTRDRVKELAVEIERGPFITNDVNYQRISKQLLQNRGYFCENPLKFNY